MSSLREEVEKIDSTVDLIRGRLASNDPFSYVLETVVGVTAGDRADTWITMHEAANRTAEILSPDRAYPGYRRERLGALKVHLDRGLKELREQVRPKVFFEDRTPWDKLERTHEMEEAVEQFMERAPGIAKAIRSNPQWHMLKAYLEEGTRPTGASEWKALVRQVVDVEGTVQKEYQEMEKELAGACRRCDRLIAALDKRAATKLPGDSDKSGPAAQGM